MKKIPKKLKIGGYDIEVIIENNRTKERGTDFYGSAVCHHNKIFLDGSVHKQIQESTLLHEIIEIINFHYQLKLEHRTITLLETSLYQVLEDNPLY